MHIKFKPIQMHIKFKAIHVKEVSLAQKKLFSISFKVQSKTTSTLNGVVNVVVYFLVK